MQRCRMEEALRRSQEALLEADRAQLPHGSRARIASGARPRGRAPDSTSAALHLNTPWSERGALGNAHGEHAILQDRLDLARVELGAEHEAAAIERRAHIGVQRLHAVGHLELQLAFDGQRVAFGP